MKTFSIIAMFVFTLLSCTNSYYTGNKAQDSLMKQVDQKLSYNDTVYKVWSKMIRHGDSVVSFAINKSNNQLITFALAENKLQKRTFYHLVNGELVKVQYFPAPGNVSNFYFFENGGLLYKRQRIADSTEHQKFLDDIIALKKIYGVN